MFFGDGPIQVMRFFPSQLFLSLVLVCKAKALQVRGTGDPSILAVVPAGLWVLRAETARSRAPVLQFTGLVPSGEGTGGPNCFILSPLFPLNRRVYRAWEPRYPPTL